MFPHSRLPILTTTTLDRNLEDAPYRKGNALDIQTKMVFSLSVETNSIMESALTSTRTTPSLANADSSTTPGFSDRPHLTRR